MLNLVLYEFVVWVGAGIDQEKVLEAIKVLFGSFAIMFHARQWKVLASDPDLKKETECHMNNYRFF